ncbi:MAG TPA: Hsp20/alpha crystallin family protein [Patescibacteria group bacterium]|nr:Hsp20/alpha crystallin family protein [Patescibacteria group bacterium]
MQTAITPRRLNSDSLLPTLRMPSFLSDFFDEGFWPTLSSLRQSGLSVSEDDKHIYIDASVPGVEPSKVEVTYDRGQLWIRGNAEEEVKDRRYRQRSSRAFSYYYDVPSYVDDTKEPQVVIKNGILTATFDKQPQAQPRKLKVKIE